MSPKSAHRPKHALIAGCGYLGRRTADAWRDAGIPVTVITRSNDKAESLRQAGFSTVTADLATGPLPDLPDVDTMLWAVGYDRSANVDRRAVWIDGLRRLLHALPQSVTRLMYVSSTGVYGECAGETVSEQTAANPVTESGQCCVEAEALIRAAGSHERDGIVLRLAGIYGPDRLLRRIDDLRTQKPLPGNPDSPLNLIHVDDAVTAITRLAARGTVPPLLNVVNTGTLTRRDYYSELARLTNSPAPVFGDPENADRVRGGHKTVTSDVRASLQLPFRFDDVRLGLQNAVRNG